jgi:AcrR family transcriptional regulator
MTEATASQRMTSRDIKAHERRQQILAVAKKMFAAGGYHATSMRSLNKELGVADALTYHYFPGGKLEILQTIIREGRDAQIAQIQALAPQLKGDLPLREALLLAAHMGTYLFSADAVPRKAGGFHRPIVVYVRTLFFLPNTFNERSMNVIDEWICVRSIPMDTRTTTGLHCRALFFIILTTFLN